MTRSELEERCEQLQQRYDGLQENYNNLKKRYEQLERRHDTMRLVVVTDEDERDVYDARYIIVTSDHGFDQSHFEDAEGNEIVYDDYLEFMDTMELHGYSLEEPNYEFAILKDME